MTAKRLSGLAGSPGRRYRPVPGPDMGRSEESEFCESQLLGRVINYVFALRFGSNCQALKPRSPPQRNPLNSLEVDM
ncbi:hypothetical protein RUM44_009271 [Polyplax serrata]|uniref:Uncharacterized protein n=1 Tax=Polyplax serrata TaxID=468196 RepID=A0ABR1AS77_POLSC